ncbi:MAG: hypothetical protein KW793_02660 [Candidatus Doudnabacteria bacterium]|nr:hypothetical protein [Candidatus Doudnabacteria bacterium]
MEEILPTMDNSALVTHAMTFCLNQARQAVLEGDKNRFCDAVEAFNVYCDAVGESCGLDPDTAEEFDRLFGEMEKITKQVFNLFRVAHQEIVH